MAKKFCITFVRTSCVDYVIEAEDEFAARHEAWEMFDMPRLNNEFGKAGYGTEIGDVCELDEGCDLVPNTFVPYEPTY